MIKTILKIIGIIALLIILFFVYILVSLEFEARKRKAEEEKVKITVEYSLEKCTKDYPLYITITNGANKTINSVSFYLDITRKEYSTNIADYLGNQYTSDKIIKPDSIFSSCWNYKLDPKYEKYNIPNNLNFEIWNKSVWFGE